MICYLLAMGKQHLGPHVVVGYGIKIFWPGLFITSPDHLEFLRKICHALIRNNQSTNRSAAQSCSFTCNFLCSEEPLTTMAESVRGNLSGS